MRIHFIAIGGSVMHDLAISLAKMGHQVTGSDDQIVEPSRSKLRDAGLLPDTFGWDAERISSDLDAIILGNHALANNEELLRAQELNIKIYSFPEFIYEQTLNKTRVVIAGTYGKTTIVSMVMHVFKKLGKEFDYLVGAKLEGFDSLIKLSIDSPIVLIEGDEFYASSIDNHSKFHHYHPNIALISNIHWDNFKSLIEEGNYLEQFEVFINTIVPKGTLIYNKEDYNVIKVVADTKQCKINRHGYKIPNFTINKGVTSVEVGDKYIPLQIIGRQNLSNIAGAYTLCEWLGVTKIEFYEAIKDFKSSIRYLEFVASNGNSVVYQDFAYSPAKLVSSIHTIKEQFPELKLLTVIELSVYDVLNDELMQQYIGTVSESENLIVLINSVSVKEVNLDLVKLYNNIGNIFNSTFLKVVYDIPSLEGYIESFDSEGFNMLFVNSNYNSGINLLSITDKFFSNKNKKN